MRYGAHLLRTALLLVLLGTSMFGHAAVVPTGFLDIGVWTGPAGEHSPADMVAGRVVLSALGSKQAVLPLGPGKEVWLRARLASREAPGAVVSIPLSILDHVTVYQPNAQGGWLSQSAGDHVPMGTWPIAARYPSFPLQLKTDQPTEILIQVRHSLPAAVPLQIESAADYFQRAQFEYLGLGFTIGTFTLLLASSLFRAWAHRDRAYLQLAGYALVSALAVAANTGVAAHLFWGNAGRWVDLAPGVMAILAGTLASFVTAHLSAASTRSPRLGLVLRGLGWTGIPLALAYGALERSVAVAGLAVYLLLVSGVGVLAALGTWRRGDPVGRWMVMGTAPLAVAVVTSLARVFSFIETSWFTEYALLLALMFDLPMLLLALNSRSRERRAGRLRQLASESQDPLTGLPKAKTFYARLLHALQRYASGKEPTAIVMLELTNYRVIRDSLGSEAAEESLLRSVIKLRALLRDIDTAGRLGEARFGVILEGVASRQRLSEFATRLVAASLMEDPDATDPPLRFNIVCTLLTEYAPPPEELMADMAAMLSSMSPATRRPIRFLTAADLPISARNSDGLQIA